MTARNRLFLSSLAALLALVGVRASAQGSFVNFETPQVHPLERTPGGLLLAVNTADGVLEVFDTSGTDLTPVQVGAVPVGFDPVSVRARTETEAWVVNHVSDSVSIVDLTVRILGAVRDELHSFLRPTQAGRVRVR